MDVQTADGQLRRRGVEVLILNLTELTAVDGVGHRGGELRSVEVVRAAANLLVRREADGNGAVRDLRMREQLRAGGDDLGHARLVVRAEERRAVGHDQLLPDIALQRRIVPRREHRRAERQLAALIAHDARLNVFAARGGRGVHVGDQAEGACVLATGRGRQVRVDIAVFVKLRALHPERVQLVGQSLAQDALTRRAGDGVGRLVRRRIKEHIAQKSLQNHAVSLHKRFIFCCSWAIYAPCMPAQAAPARPPAGGR